MFVNIGSSQIPETPLRRVIMRASLTKSLGSAVVVASSLVLSLPGASAAQASPKNDSSTASACVTPLGSSQSQSHGEYAEILNVKLE